MKKVLVFGGFGFLGHYLVNELINRDYEVTVADIHDNEKVEGKITYIKCDITIEENIKNVFENKQFDFVYNLAGFANLDTAVKYPIETMKLNVIGNMYILKECVKNRLEMIKLISYILNKYK